MWLSTASFGLYIFGHYGLAGLRGAPERWNIVLPGLYEPGSLVATVAIGVHFVAGALLLALGVVQLVAPLRERAPAVHRWLGRIYVAAALAAGVGGTTFVLLRGTIGGWPMDLGFGGYGVATIVAAAFTLRFAVARELDRHRLWAHRLFALAIGSWLYRLAYGFWFGLTGAVGHTDTFDGGFDLVMHFGFWVPNLVFVELWSRAPAARGGRWALSLGAIGAAGLVLLATVLFARAQWIPTLLGRFG